MTKQEEIRGEIAFTAFLYSEAMNCSSDWEDMPKKKRQVWYEIADKIVERLNLSGVVIKVKCPDCNWSQFGDESVGMTPCYCCNSTGYILKAIDNE